MTCESGEQDSPTVWSCGQGGGSFSFILGGLVPLQSSELGNIGHYFTGAETKAEDKESDFLEAGFTGGNSKLRRRRG